MQGNVDKKGYSAQLFQEVKNWKAARGWYIWKLKLVDARLYFVNMVVGLLTGLMAVPYHYQLYYLLHVHSGFFASRPAWYWYISLFMLFWGILILVSRLADKIPLIGGGGILQTRGAINGWIIYRHPFIELMSKLVSGILSVSTGLSFRREGSSIQIGFYVGCLVSRWTHTLRGERKQLLTARAGAGLAAVFAALLAFSLIVTESIGRFDTPKTAVTTLLADVVADVIATLVLPVSPYHLIEVLEPALAFWAQMKYSLISTVIISTVGELYTIIMILLKRAYSAVKSLTSVKMFYLALVAYIISSMQVNLTDGGERFLLEQVQNGSAEIMWVLAVMLLHFGFSACSVSSGLSGGNFIPTLVTDSLLGRFVGPIAVKYDTIGQEGATHIMSISMSAFLVAIERTPLTAIVLTTEITRHFRVFHPSVVVGGLIHYFAELLQMKSFNAIPHEDMVSSSDSQEERRYTLSVEVVTGLYFNGKTVGELSLPEHCVITGVHRDGRNLIPVETSLIPGDQVQTEMDSQDTEKLYEPLASMANIY